MKQFLIRILIASFALSSTLFGAAASAQTLSVIGNHVNAKDCYQYAKMGKASKRAIKVCDSAIENDLLNKRDLAAVYVNRGILHRMDWEISAASKDYNAALRLIPDLPEAIANRGNLYYLAERYERALQDYQKAQDLGISDERPVRLNTAMALGSLKRHTQAIAAYEDVISRYPEWELAQTKYENYKAKRAEALAHG